MSFAAKHARRTGRVRRQHHLSAVTELLEPRRLLTGEVPTVINYFEISQPVGPAPYSGLTQFHGTLYGTTYQGGQTNNGFIYAVNPNATSYNPLSNIVVAQFDGTNGSDPKDALTAVGNVLYCATENGVISEFNPANDSITAVAHLPGSNVLPDNTMLNVGGMLYGDTTAGGAHNTGFLYEFNPTTKVVTTLYSFVGTAGSAGASLTTLLDINGSLYGTVEGNGAHGDGYIFRYNLTSKAFTTLFSFDGTDGSTPECGLIDVNGYLYGTTSADGAHNGGTLIKLDLANNSLTTLVNFVPTSNDFVGTSPIGGIPIGTLTVNNGLIYGACQVGGDNPTGGGTIWDFNPSTNSLTVLGYLSVPEGIFPNGNIVFVNNVLFETTNGDNNGFGGWPIALYPPTSIQLDPELHNLTIRLDPSNTSDLEVLNGTAKYADYSLQTLSALNIVGDASITSSVKVDYSDGWFYQPVSFQGAGSHNSLSIVDGPNIEVPNQETTVWTFGSGSASMSLASQILGDGNNYDPNVNYNGVQTVSFSGRASGAETLDIQSAVVLGETLPTSTVLNVTSHDTIDVQSTESPISIIGSGSDTTNQDQLFIGSTAPSLGGTLGHILAPVTVNNISEVTADDSGDTANTSGTLTSSSITGFGMPSTGAIDYTSVEELKIHGSSGANVDTITGDAATTAIFPGNHSPSSVFIRDISAPLTVNGQGHTDSIYIGNGTASNITAPITVTDTGSSSVVVLDDSTDTTARTGTISATSVKGFGMGSAAALNYTGSQLATLSVSGGSGANTETVTGTSAHTYLYPGDSKTVFSTVAVRATTAPLTIDGNGYLAAITIGSLAPGLGGTLTGITGPITVTNTSADSTLTLDDSGDTVARTGTLTPTTVTGLGMGSGAKVTYTGSGLHYLSLRGNKGGARLTETGTSCTVALYNITVV